MFGDDDDNIYTGRSRAILRCENPVTRRALTCTKTTAPLHCSSGFTERTRYNNIVMSVERTRYCALARADIRHDDDNTITLIMIIFGLGKPLKNTRGARACTHLDRVDDTVIIVSRRCQRGKRNARGRVKKLLR